MGSFYLGWGLLGGAFWKSSASNHTLLARRSSSCPLAAAAAAASLQLCPTLCDPTDSSPPGSPVPGILQARTLEWVAISFSNAGKWKVKWKSLSRVRLLVTPWTAAYQALPSMGFSRQEYWSGVPLPSSSCPLTGDKMPPLYGLVELILTVCWDGFLMPRLENTLL